MADEEEEVDFGDDAPMVPASPEKLPNGNHVNHAVLDEKPLTNGVKSEDDGNDKTADSSGHKPIRANGSGANHSGLDKSLDDLDPSSKPTSSVTLKSRKDTRAPANGRGTKGADRDRDRDRRDNRYGDDRRDNRRSSEYGNRDYNRKRDNSGTNGITLKPRVKLELKTKEEVAKDEGKSKSKVQLKANDNPGYLIS